MEGSLAARPLLTILAARPPWVPLPAHPQPPLFPHLSVPQLRLIFPEADAFKLALRAPILVLGASRPRLERAAQQLRRLLPGLNVDRLVEAAPELLDVKALRGALKVREGES